MIELSRLNGDKLWVNPDLIRIIESLPETSITFMDDKKLFVKESPEKVNQLILQHKHQITKGHVKEG